MDLENETESRTKLDEQKRKFHEELRDIEKFYSSCEKWRKGGSAEKIAKDTKHPGQKKEFAERQYHSRRGDAEAQKGERLLVLSNKVDRHKMGDAEMAAELHSLQAGEERRGNNASQTGDCCMEALWRTCFWKLRCQMQSSTQ